MSVDDLDAGKCPMCGGNLIEREDGWLECDSCDYREEN